ncbi:hypothetical protein SKAU_G00017540 [Synaphobranchus kaupii]|uniref:Sema domain-containing protein n=1 Tax=Synaphobranchus kaupii TaxID=118154 RepID=A0A9Q1GCG2_SYNKA|nr:hypothetical protein SKAU_G00017540 [Synaphobranchus kaupii]
MRSAALLLYLTLLQFVGAGFPEDSEPISISHGNYTKQYPAFVGHKPGRNNTQRHRLDIQLIVIMNRTLYIAARDHIYAVDMDTANTEEIFFSKKLTWKSRQADVDTCRMKGKHKDECHNFIKVLLQQNNETLFVCGTNAFNPSCRAYKMDSLDALSEEISGMARCPYDAKHANVALFADGKLYSATITDFLAIDAVIYRSLGDSPTLRTVKHDSKWLKEPYFVQAVDYGDFIYFFFREIAMEYNTMGKVLFPRWRGCVKTTGGARRESWRSSGPPSSRPASTVPSPGTPTSTSTSSRPSPTSFTSTGTTSSWQPSPHLTTAFPARQSAPTTWRDRGRLHRAVQGAEVARLHVTPVPEERVPKPRPGCCAGKASTERYKLSSEFPDDTLNFIKMHPLMDEAVPSITNRPWFLKTMVRYRLTRIAVDNAAGPPPESHRRLPGVGEGDHPQVPGQDERRLPQRQPLPGGAQRLQPEKCTIDGVEDKRIISMQIDSKGRTLFVAFTSCVVRVPLSRCERHGRCKKSCIASRDPYCGWVAEGACREVGPDTKSVYEQDVEHGNTDGLGDCQNSFVALNGRSTYPSHTTAHPPERGPLGHGRMVEQKEPPVPSDKKDPYIAVPSQPQQDVNGVIRESYQKGRDQLVPVTLLAIAVILAFAMGAIFSGIIVYCVCDHRRRDLELSGRKDKEAAQSRRGSMNSVTKLTGLFETQAKDGRPEAILTPLMHGGRMGSANGKMLIKADQHHLDLAALPTPESTPMQPRRKPSRGSREWERNQNLINACTKDLPPMGSPVIPTDLPLRASPGHIPSVVVLPLPQHQQAYQHEYVEHPHRADLGQMGLEDQGATLEYKALKSPLHGLNLVEKDNVPPRVPQREASLSVPAAVPQMGKRLEVHSSMYGHEYKRGYPLSSQQKGSALKKHNTNSSNSSHLSRNHSFTRVENPPPAPQRVDSIHMTSQGVSLSRQPSMSSYGSLPRTGAKYLKPDVPPKPSLVSLSTNMKSNDSCT